MHSGPLKGVWNWDCGSQAFKISHFIRQLFIWWILKKVSSNLGSAMKKAGKHWRLLTLNEELLSCWKMTNIYTKKVSWSTLYIWYVIFDEYEERIYFSHTELKSIALDFNSNHPPLIYSHSHCSYSLCWYIFSFLLMFGPCDVKRNLCKIVLEIFCS